MGIEATSLMYSARTSIIAEVACSVVNDIAGPVKGVNVMLTVWYLRSWQASEFVMMVTSGRSQSWIKQDVIAWKSLMAGYDKPVLYIPRSMSFL